MLEKKDIRIEEESSGLEIHTSKNSSSIEDKDSAYVDEKNPKLSENQRTYGERPNLSKRPRKTITNLQNTQSPPEKMLHNETVLTKNQIHMPVPFAKKDFTIQSF